MATLGRRVAVVGATGTVGSEVIEALERRRVPVAELRAFASEDSLGETIEFMGEIVDVEAGEPRLAGCDVAVLCAPPGPSLEAARLALRAGVPVIDVSGVLAARSEVPLLRADPPPPAESLAAPAISALSGTALAWAHVLAPLHERLTLRRVVGTALEAASGGGRAGIAALTDESIALFNQSDAPGDEAFGHPVAFDCVPLCGEPAPGGGSVREQALATALQRVFSPELRVNVTAVRVPVFCGDGATLWIETETAPDADDVVASLDKVDSVSVWPDPGPALSTRTATGLNQVLVGRVRVDPDGALQLWLASDLPRISALNAVQLVEARLERQ